MSGAEICIIYPPPEIRNIVDKTAGFVARNGPEFETRIQQNEPNNRKFNFLKPGDPYNAYYQFKVKEFRESSQSNETGGGAGQNEQSSVVGQQKSAAVTVDPNAQNGNQTLNQVITEAKVESKKFENIMEIPIIPRGPPPAFEFSDDPPSISAFDLDIVKLTAQFVAIHGRSFLNTLMNKESRNYQFDFLRPQHGLFTYFTQLIEQYSRVLMPTKQFLQIIDEESRDPLVVLKKVRYRTEWTKIQEAEKRKEAEEAEKERIQYAQIDWHDFVIVETVDYQPSETGNFPPPTTPEQVGTRLLLQQRIEANGSQAVEMDVDSDEEKNEESSKEAAKKNEPLPPLPPSLDNVLIRKDYDPKANKAQQAQVAAPSTRLPDNYVISPITGAKIPADKLQEHMRYSLLDPRWVEQRDRTIQDRMQQEEVYAAGSAIESSLKNLAERRTDIFGMGDEETSIGRKIGEEEQQRKQEKVTWDGHMNSVEATTRAARANITIEEQIQHIHKVKGLLPDSDKDKIGPAIPSSSSNINSASSIISQPPLRIPGLTATSGILSNPSMIHHAQPPSITDYGLIGTGLHPPPHGTLYAPTPLGLAPHMMVPGRGLIDLSLEPAFKKARTEGALIPEQEFLQSCSPNVMVKIHVPHSVEKPEWKLNGQVINLTLPYTDTLSVVKAKIHELINLPPGKQKLQYEGIFLKDQSTLAYYNVPTGASIILALKERGGRKK